MSENKNIFTIFIEAPIERVWETLTQTETILPFFFNAKCVTTGLQPGAPVRMQTADGRYTSVVGEVLEFEPPRRYAHTFKFTSLDDPLCKVTYDLKPVAGGTEFSLISEQLVAGTKTKKYMLQGSTFIGKNLKALVETGKASFGGRIALFMMGLTAFMTPAKCKSEHWPLDVPIRDQED